jgi:hypothetical protein
MTSVMVRPSSFASAMAASHSSFGTRTLRFGVSPVAGRATAATPRYLPPRAASTRARHTEHSGQPPDPYRCVG